MKCYTVHATVHEAFNFWMKLAEAFLWAIFLGFFLAHFSSCCHGAKHQSLLQGSHEKLKILLDSLHFNPPFTAIILTFRWSLKCEIVLKGQFPLNVKSIRRKFTLRVITPALLNHYSPQISTPGSHLDIIQPWFMISIEPHLCWQ